MRIHKDCINKNKSETTINIPMNQTTFMAGRPASTINIIQRHRKRKTLLLVRSVLSWPFKTHTIVITIALYVSFPSSNATANLWFYTSLNLIWESNFPCISEGMLGELGSFLSFLFGMIRQICVEGGWGQWTLTLGVTSVFCICKTLKHNNIALN